MSGSCAQLAMWLLNVPSQCQQLEFDAAARASQQFPMGGIHRTFNIPRARFGLGLASEGTHVRAIWGTVRSAGDTSYIGIDGESFVPQLQLLELGWTVNWASLRAGMIDDLWVVPQNNYWRLRSISADVSERSDVMGRSDLGGMIMLMHPSELFNIQFQMRSGEGHRFRERNTGQNMIVRAELKPLKERQRLAVAVLAQDGSRGFGFARDHRVGAQLYSSISDTRFGVEGIHAWGVGGDSLREPLLLSAWGQYLPEQGFQSYLRVDQHRELGLAQRNTLHLGMGYRPVGDFRIWFGGEQSKFPDDVTGLQGADGIQVQREIFIQLDGHFRWIE